MKPATKIIPVILCGGSGTRLWPVSREKLPKQFLKLLGDLSLLQQTAVRALSITGAPEDHVVTVTLAAQKKSVVGQLSQIDKNLSRHVLGEPMARNTAAAVAYAASYVAQKFGSDAMMWILSADHYMGDEQALAKAYEAALVAAEQGYLVTFGINPTRPETGYGYIKLAKGDAKSPYQRVESFVEKPDRATAEAYLADGSYLWNSGMFLFRAETVLMSFQQFASDILSGVRKSMNDLGPTPDLYGVIPEQPFDKAIMEKSDRVAVVPCDPQWSDIGSWESLWEISPKDARGNVVDGRVALAEADNCMIMAKERLVAVAGVRDFVVIETADAILVGDRTNSDHLKTIVKALKSQNAPEVSETTEEDRPWGRVKTINQEKGYRVREIHIAPDYQQSLQMHNHRGEMLTVVDGEATIQIGNTLHTVGAQESIFIPPKAIHRISNNTNRPLRMIEVQTGAYIGEDDIVRFEDKYGRVA